MLTVPELKAIAEQVHSAQVAVGQIEPITSRIPTFDLSSAYAVAQILHEGHVKDGAVPVGRKIGFTNSDMWALYGVKEPIWAYVYDRTVRPLATIGGICSIRQFAEPKIEPEVVFHFHSTPPVGTDLPALLACVDWVAHAFEIVQSHFPGWKFEAADTVADSSLHGVLLLGDPVPVHQLAQDPVAALESFSVELSCDGSVRGTGTGANVLGSPLKALAHLVALLSRLPEGVRLHANELVTTGTLTAAQTIKPGEFWQTRLNGIGLPSLSIKFVP